jgi:hypothetical protein
MSPYVGERWTRRGHAGPVRDGGGARAAPLPRQQPPGILTVADALEVEMVPARETVASASAYGAAVPRELRPLH